MVEDVLLRIGESRPHPDLVDSLRELSERIEQGKEGPIGASMLASLADAIEKNEAHFIHMARWKLDGYIEDIARELLPFGSIFDYFDPAEFLEECGLQVFAEYAGEEAPSGQCEMCGMNLDQVALLSNKQVELTMENQKLQIEISKMRKDLNLLSIQNRSLKNGK